MAYFNSRSFLGLACFGFELHVPMSFDNYAHGKNQNIPSSVNKKFQNIKFYYRHSF